MAVNYPTTDTIVTLKNGVLKDTTTGRFVKGGKVSTAIASPSQAREMVERKMEKKRERLMAGANAIVAKGGDYDGTDLDFVEAIGEAVTLAALDPTSSQQVKAAEFLFREAGIGERQAVQDTAGGTIGALADVIGALSAFAGSIAALSADNAFDQPGGVIDADVMDADSMAHSDTVQAGDTDNGGE